ncbi:MAG: hypothetical protein ACRDI2_13330 [Chloroflexota bacterium]
MSARLVALALSGLGRDLLKLAAGLAVAVVVAAAFALASVTAQAEVTGVHELRSTVPLSRAGDGAANAVQPREGDAGRGFGSPGAGG